MPELLDRLKAALANRYTLERELGAGGMATVYLAEDLKHHRKVALKVLRPELAAVLGADRFLREIEIAARLNHPHILPLHDSGEAEGFLYYVMPYVEGESLRHRLNREKQLPVEDALQIAREVADALDYAHRHDTVHRDIKPENILLEEHHAVVADFGIARAIRVAGGEKLTATGVAVGTPEYMSPEQASGRGELDGRSDVYALGCVLYEMLAGQPPFTGPTVESVVHQHLTAAAPAVTAIRPAVPAPVAAALVRALAKTPADRFSSVGLFGQALREDSPVAPGVRRTLRWPQWAAAAAALVGLVALAWASGLVGRGSTGGRPTPRAPTIVADAEGNADQGVRTAIRELVRTVLDQSGILVTVPQEEVQRGLQLAGRPETTTIGPELARELAVRGSIRTVVAPRLDRLGQRYTLTVRVLDAERGEPLATETGTADSDDALVPAVERTMRAIRSRLGERASDIQRDRPLVQVSTPSFEAYRHYVESQAFWARADRAGAVAVLRQALTRDPDMAAAWMMLAVHLGDQGKPDSARIALAEAQRRPERLTDRDRLFLEERLANVDGHYARRVRLLSLAIDRDPLNAPLYNMLALTLGSFDRWEEALETFDRAITVSPFGPAQLHIINRGQALLALGRFAEAEANAQKVEGELRKTGDITIAVSRGDWARAESLGVAFERDQTMNTFRRVRATVAVAGAHAAQGELRAARQALERARGLGITEGSVGNTSWVLRTELTLALASGEGLTPRPLPALADTLTVALWAAATRDTVKARRLVMARNDSAVHRSARVIAWREVEAMIAAVGGNWAKVIDLLNASALQALPVSGGNNGRSQAARWLVAEAYERLEHPDSAATYFDLIASDNRLVLQDRFSRGIAHSFAHQRLVVLYASMGRLDDARRHWKVFSETFTNPDPEVKHLLDEAREALQRAERERR